MLCGRLYAMICMGLRAVIVLLSLKKAIEALPEVECHADVLNVAAAGWFEWALRVNTSAAGVNVWGFAQCYELGYLKYADLFGVPS